MQSPKRGEEQKDGHHQNSTSPAHDHPHTTRPWLTTKSVLNFRTVSFVTVLNFPTVGGGYFILWSVY